MEHFRWVIGITIHMGTDNINNSVNSDVLKLHFLITQVWLNIHLWVSELILSCPVSSFLPDSSTMLTPLSICPSLLSVEVEHICTEYTDVPCTTELRGQLVCFWWWPLQPLISCTVSDVDLGKRWVSKVH